MFNAVALIVSLYGVLNEVGAMERIHACGTRCPKGLPCKSKPHYSFSPCRSQPIGLGSSALHNVSLSTVMSCWGKQQCSLHLRLQMFLQLNEHLHGVSICTVTAGMLGRCTLISFPKAARERLAGHRVEVQRDCFDVGPGQDIHVTLKSVPSYCGVTWTNTYHVPECHDEDLRRNIPECITGRLSYTVDHTKKELSVSVSDALDNKDYHLRLCYKGYICRDTGAKALVKKEVHVKNATLTFSRPLPCLCIEGWSATLDAPRVQVCPFKYRLEELWTGVNFDPVEETLSWQAACSVAAVVSLCQLEEDGVCVNLPNASFSAGRDKIFFSKVDPHPQLCMKFSVRSESWIKCPFSQGSFQTWELSQRKHKGQQQLVLTSRVEGTFSLGVCMKSGSDLCQPVHTHTVHVQQHQSVDANITEDFCKACVQVKRLNIKFAATSLYCHLSCSDVTVPGLPANAELTSTAHWEVSWVILSAGACLTTVIVTALLLIIVITFFQRKYQKDLADGCTIKQPKEAYDAVCVLPAPEHQDVVYGGNLMTHTLQLESCDKANLLND